MRTINISNHIIIPKKGDNSLKSQELLDNLNSISDNEIDDIGDEIETSKRNAEEKEQKIVVQEHKIKKKISTIRDKLLKRDEKSESIDMSSKSLEELHEEIDKKICMKIFDKVKDCRGDRRSIGDEIVKYLTKGTNLKPVYLENKTDSSCGGWYNIYFDSSVRTGTGNNGEPIGWLIITVSLKSTDSGDYETYIGYGLDRIEKDWNGYRAGYSRPVNIRHSDNVLHFDSKNKSSKLLEEKIKFYESL